MFVFLKMYILFNIQNIIVECLIPSLSVRKIDRKLIQQKRHDTLEMCKIFTAENEQMKQTKEPRKPKTSNNKNHGHLIVKRNANIQLTGNPGLNILEAKRVEDIVDKLYDDIQENGKPVAYRRKNLQNIVPDIKSKKARRFNFAPAELLSPLPTSPVHTNNIVDDGTSKIKWPKRWKQGIVPYFIDSKTYDSHLAELIIKAFDYFEKATCIRLQRLREKPIDKESMQSVEWLYITNPSGLRQCVHTNERKKNKGVQMVVFGYDCLNLGEIVHEVMHILGFSHEHTRPDRDQHISILWDNIKPGYKKYFQLRTEDPLMMLSYDYASVLHYPSRAFSRNGQVTIFTEPIIKIGQREGLSETDIEKIGMIYGNECVERNRQYLLHTCPSVVKANTEKKNVTQEEIEDYFQEKLWPYGIVNYKIRDRMEFSAEERENINAVIRHIEKETCIQFQDYSLKNNDYDSESPKSNTVNRSEGIARNETVTANKHLVILKNPTNNENESNKHNIIKKPEASEDEIKVLNVNSDQFTNDINITDNEIEDKKEIKHKSTETIDNRHSVLINANDEFELLRKNSINMQKKNGTQAQKRVRRAAVMPPPASRRHAVSVLILTRSTEPGCQCPDPGKPDKEKVLQISIDCFNSVNDLLHLFVHVLGLEHQHNMYDRDSYIHISWDQLTPEIKDELRDKLPPAASVGFSYDYQSVMHYPWLQIKDGVTNIMYPIWNDGWAMGHWQGLSSTDVNKLNLLYFKECQRRKKYTK